MYYRSYSRNTILDFLVTIVMVGVLVSQPFSIAIAQESETVPPPETVVTEVPVEEPPAVTAPLDVPLQQGGTDGVTGGDGSGGGDGTSPNDPPNPSADPLPGEKGTTTTSGTAAPTGGTGETSTTPLSTTTVTTGDAAAQGNVKNYIDVNELMVKLNEMNAKYNLPLGYIVYDHATGKYIAYSAEAQKKLDKALLDGVIDPYEFLDIVTPELNTTASSTNETVLNNAANIGANTGENIANNNHNTAIKTGNAQATANVLNVVNTNIYDSEGFFLFLDNLSKGGVSGNLDLRGYDFFNPTLIQSSSNGRSSAGGDANNLYQKVIDKVKAICPSCGGKGDLTVNTSQDAQITNDVVVRSSSGLNEASGGSGSASITTGDAYAAANVINLANTNIIDSNYLLLTFNNYGDWNGDIVFPSAQDLMKAFSVGGQTTPAITANNQNTTAVNNNANLNAGTGGNTANGAGGGGAIATGNATASTNVLNQLNSNLIGGTSFSILIKVHGTWSGNVIGAPEGIEWRETPEGIEIFYDPEGTKGGTSGYDALNITGNNSATINNNIDVVALTGKNKVKGAGGSASITTGDAHAAANVINVANTNVIGKNWLMAVFNIFGDWNGSLTFGQPNLWVGAKVEIPGGSADPGEEISYHYTIMNTGDAPAENVCLRNRFDHRYLTFEITQPTREREVRSGEVEYCVGNLNAGGIYEFSRRAWVSKNIPYGSTYVENNIEVNGLQKEDYTDDNFEMVSFDIQRAAPKAQATGGTKIEYSPSADLKISKRNNAPFGKRASTTINYRIVIDNVGPGPAHNAVLVDTLMDTDGSPVYKEYWNLETILPGEHIEITYSTFFNAKTKPGEFSNSAVVEALSGHDTFLYGHTIKSNTALSKVVILPYLGSLESKPAQEEHKEEVVVEEEVASLEVPGEEIVAIARFPLRKIARFDHPRFTQHPVYYNPYISPYPLNHPRFTQHPIFIASSPFALLNVALTQFSETSKALTTRGGAALLHTVNWPFVELSKLSLPHYIRESSKELDEDHFLAFLAMSVFAIRRKKQFGQGDEIL